MSMWKTLDYVRKSDYMLITKKNRVYDNTLLR